MVGEWLRVEGREGIHCKSQSGFLKDEKMVGKAFSYPCDFSMLYNADRIAFLHTAGEEETGEEAGAIKNQESLLR